MSFWLKAIAIVVICIAVLFARKLEWAVKIAIIVAVFVFGWWIA